MKGQFGKFLLRTASYIAVAVVTAVVSLTLFAPTRELTKLSQLEKLISQRFVGEAEVTQLMDAAAYGMVTGTGDRWSTYIPASQYQAYQEQMNNTYVGIGVTVAGTLNEQGLEIYRVEPNGGAKAAGLLPGDIIHKVDGALVTELGMDKTKEMIRGDGDSTVVITVVRGIDILEFTVARGTVKAQVARGQMLNATVGFVRIYNFDERCGEETIEVIENLLEQGAQRLVFDVRNNPGGYKKELVEVLDYLLPEGEIFRTVRYDGKEEITQSDAASLDVPMAVLVNRDSYSAAEFFAAALGEYDKAVIVGQQTVGKSYFQETYSLVDGSAVALSVGKYYTPKGVSLADVGGLIPDVEVQVDEAVANGIYGETTLPENDPQLQAAVRALES